MSRWISMKICVNDTHVGLFSLFICIFPSGKITILQRRRNPIIVPKLEQSIKLFKSSDLFLCLKFLLLCQFA